MNRDSFIYVAGHRGLVGSSIVRKLEEQGFRNLITRTHTELDLTCQAATDLFFKEYRPEYVFLAAAKVGGIVANNTYKAQFIYENLAIACNVIHSAHTHGTKKLLNLGSSCIYPRLASQPIKEDCLLTDSLEPTNEPYAVAKIAAIKLCRYYNEQYGCNFISGMPTNLYGPNDNFDLETSHVLPALLRKFHMSKLVQDGNTEQLEKDIRRFGPVDPEFLQHLKEKQEVILWGTGAPYREFLYNDDLADACLFLMQNHSAQDIGEFINIGTGMDTTIKELAELVKETVGAEAAIHWDAGKPDGTPRKLLDIGKITSLGWQPKTDLRTGLLKYYEWYKKESGC